LSVKEFIDNFLIENQKNLNSKNLKLHFSYNNPEELYFWAKFATIDELLKTPSIIYIDER